MMVMTDDMKLLREYAADDSQEAFATLVSHHINLVYSAALRHTSNPDHAEEITQAVFIILAKKASSLPVETILSGWLYQTTRFTAANFLRGEMRRIHREQEAFMESLSAEAGAEPDHALWQQIAPMLDDALASLNEKDRNAIVLRFFEGKDMAEIGTALGASEDAAKMRVSRAVDKLRSFFGKRGVAATASGLAVLISANSVQAAPIGLASSVSAVAAMKGAAASGSTIALIKGTLKAMTWTKYKIVFGIGAAVLIATTTATIAVLTNNTADAAKEILQSCRAKYDSMTSYRDSGKTVSEANGITLTHTFSIKLARPNLYKIEWEHTGIPGVTNSGAVWSVGEGNFTFHSKNQYHRRNDVGTTFNTMAGVSGSASQTIPGTFFNMGSTLDVFGNLANLKREKDEKVGDVDCYVLSGSSAPKNLANVTTGDRHLTLWIGKSDSFIYRRRLATKNLKATLPNTNRGEPANTVSAEEIVSTETHENIVINEPIAKEEFNYEVPAGVRLR